MLSIFFPLLERKKNHIVCCCLRTADITIEGWQVQHLLHFRQKEEAEGSLAWFLGQMPAVVWEPPFLPFIKNQGEVRQVPDQTAGSTLNHSF